MLRIKWHLKDFRNRFISVFVMANKYKLLWHISKIYVFIFEQFINACFMILVHVVNIFKIIIFRYRGQLRQVIPRMWPAFIPSHEGHHLPAKFPARRFTFWWPPDPPSSIVPRSPPFATVSRDEVQPFGRPPVPSTRRISPGPCNPYPSILCLLAVH